MLSGAHDRAIMSSITCYRGNHNFYDWLKHLGSLVPFKHQLKTEIQYYCTWPHATNFLPNVATRKTKDTIIQVI